MSKSYIYSSKALKKPHVNVQFLLFQINAEQKQRKKKKGKQKRKKKKNLKRDDETNIPLSA